MHHTLAKIALSTLRIRDTELRDKMQFAGSGLNDNEMRNKNSVITRDLHYLVDRFGWQALISADMDALWHLVQHADSDVTLQTQALDAYKNYDNRVMAPWRIAFLEDRICMNRRLPQVYGSQLIRSKVTKQYGPYDLYDASHVDERRKKMGMEPLAGYINSFNSNQK